MIEPDVQLAGPQWPVSETIAPTKLKTFVQCRRKTRLMYIDKVYVKEPPSLFMRQGIIAHSLLARQARLTQAHKDLLPDDVMLQDAIAALADVVIPSDEARMAHALEILAWVKWGTKLLRPDANYIFIEDHVERKHPVSNELYTFGGRPDVVMHWRDSDGMDVVDLVDYKTGRRWPEELLPAFTGFIFQRAIEQQFGAVGSIRYRFLYPWLKEEFVQEIDLDREYMEDHWPKVASTLRELVSVSDWPATTTSLCRYCMYRHDHCPVGKAHVGDEPELLSFDALDNEYFEE